MNYKLVTVLTLAGLAIIFILQNVTVVEIKFLFWSLQMSRAIFMFLMMAIGIVIGWILQSHLTHRRNR